MKFLYSIELDLTNCHILVFQQLNSCTLSDNQNLTVVVVSTAVVGIAVSVAVVAMTVVTIAGLSISLGSSGSGSLKLGLSRPLANIVTIAAIVAMTVSKTIAMS